MTFLIATRIRETSTTAGTGALALNGATSGFRSVSSAIGVGNSSFFTAVEINSDGAATGNWETFVGTVSLADSGTYTLSRDTVVRSSQGITKVNFGSATKDVFVDVPAEYLPYINPDDDILYVSAVNVSGLTASLPVATDGSRNLVSVAKAATIADPDGTLADVTQRVKDILDLLQTQNLMT